MSILHILPGLDAVVAIPYERPLPYTPPDTTIDDTEGSAIQIDQAPYNASAPAEVFWSLHDAEGVQLLAEAALDPLAIGEEKLTIKVPGANNTLASGETRTIRVVRARVRLPSVSDAWVTYESYYIVAAAEELQLQVNSFQTMGQALLASSQMTGIDTFMGASRQDKTRALIDAWKSLVTLRYHTVTDETTQNRITDFPGSDPGDLKLMSAQEFQSLDPRLIEALRRAQIVEADYRLSNGGIDQHRRAGLISTSIGEVSQMFRMGKPMDLAVSARALRELRGYVFLSPRIGR
jgi:hypothetical protein